MIDFRAQLSRDQFEAVTYLDGPELVIAGPGSGKTRVLTFKLAYLLENGYQPDSILALTFTNKAAKEMKERVSFLTSGAMDSKMYMGTFHSIFARILRDELKSNAGVLPYSAKFTIYDTDDSESVIKGIIERMELDPLKYDPSVALSRISAAKNAIIGPEMYSSTTLHQTDIAKKMPEIYKIYMEYSLCLRRQNAMDFDDLLFNIHLLFRDNEDIRKKYADRFRYCLVDEYQDTNIIQKNILLQLTKESNRICVVGDDAQSIYAFRGAVIDNFLNFKEDFPDTKVFMVKENYRATKTLVNAANSLIARNSRQIRKELYSNNPTGCKIITHRAASDRDEARFVVQAMNEMVINEKRNYGDFAILYRANWLSSIFENELRRQNIKCKIYGGVSFFQRKEIKDLLAYFRVIVMPDDEQALRRIINYPVRGIGNTTLDKLIELSVRTRKNLWQVLAQPYNYANLLNKGTVKKLLDFVHTIQRWQKMQFEVADVFAEQVFKESGMASLLENSVKEGDEDRFENIQQLLNDIHFFVESHRKDNDPAVTIEDYIREVSLLTDAEDKIDGMPVPFVKMMTVHASKGLEFPVVFVVGMDEDIFPCKQVFESSNPEKALEEERRLLYVAITRAKEACYLTGAENRYKNGNTVSCRESQFISNIDKKYLENKY